MTMIMTKIMIRIMIMIIIMTKTMVLIIGHMIMKIIRTMNMIMTVNMIIIITVIMIIITATWLLDASQAEGRPHNSETGQDGGEEEQDGDRATHWDCDQVEVEITGICIEVWAMPGLGQIGHR